MPSPETAEVKRRAAELGFSLCGIAPAEEFPELAFFRQWLDRGYHGRMGYLARTVEKRTSVQRVLPGARSVIALGTVYNTDRPSSLEASASTARIARYAWGDDYHIVIGERMEALVGWLRDRAPEPFEARAYVDTGPVQERVFSQQAGLGWIGKNTCLINPDLGSWIFLSVILTTLALETDEPGVDRCGTCTLCLEACPTGALVEPWVMDATRCISYLTIELKDVVPPSQRPDVGTHVFGCDICQEVCPFNATAAVSSDEAWQPRPAFDRPGLVELWRRSDAELRRSLKGSAMKRAGVRRLRRNVALAMANSGEASVLQALEEGRPGPPPGAGPAGEED